MVKAAVLALMASAAFVAAWPALASEGELTDPQEALLKLAPADNLIRVTAAVDHPNGYSVGDPVSITVTASEDAFVYVIDVDEQGVGTLIYPNAHAPVEILKAGERRIFPAASDTWQIVADRPGTELVKVIATKTARDLASMQKAAPAGPFKVFQSSGDELAHSLRLEVSADAARWGEAWVKFTVRSGALPSDPLSLTQADLTPTTGPFEQLPEDLPLPSFPPTSLF